MNDNQLDKENPEYDKIRHFKGTWKDFQEFWKKKGLSQLSPWEEWVQEYPQKKNMKKTDKVHSYKTFDNESTIQENDGPDLADINVKKLSKNSVKLKVGDQVIWKSKQSLGVGTLNMFHPDGTANVQFYDDLTGSTVGKPGDDFRIPTSDLKIVDALADSVQTITEAKSVEQSAGLAIVYNNKILLGHMSGKKWYSSYSIPKGHLERGESILQAALRETFEEIGVKVPKKLIPSSYLTCPYIKKGKHYKDVHYYIVHIDSLDQIGLSDEIIPKSQLQIEEIDWAGFVSIKEAFKRISPVMMPIIKNLKIYNKMSAFKTFESFVESLDEDNMVALAGSQQDHVPRPKPFVAKSIKKRKGSNEDEDDETLEVGNMNTTGLGEK